MGGVANPVPLLNIGIGANPNGSVTAFINQALTAAGLSSKISTPEPSPVPIRAGSTCEATCARYCPV